MTMTLRDTMGGLAKGLAVIETFGADRPRQSIADVAAASGLDRATARRCLLTLVQQGYAEHDGKFFTLTPRVLRLGTACLATMPLPQMVQPWLDRVSQRLGESSSLSILDGQDIVYVARSAQRKVMSISLMPGSRLPAFCTSMGRVLLAALPQADLVQRLSAQPLTARTPMTITDLPTLFARIAAVRAQGFAVIDQEVEIGLRSIAVPIADARGRVVAAMNLGLPVMNEAADMLVPRYLPTLKAVQSELRKILN